MTYVREIVWAFGRIKPLEMSLVFMNLFLVVMSWNMLNVSANVRSENIEQYVAGDLANDLVLAKCIIPLRDR